MRLAELVVRLHAEFDLPAAMADVAALCGHDRYQASEGIEAAAGYVADRAVSAGLVDVQVLRLPADGSQQWWTFRGPLGWTPVRAEVSVRGVTLLRYPEQSHGLAAYSAATAVGGQQVPVLTWSAVRAGTDPAGALVVVEPGAELTAVVTELTGRRALGLVADPLAGRPDREPGQVGRLELPPASRIAAFSATPQQCAALTAAAGQGERAHVLIEVGTGSCMPVVTGRTPGPAAERELLLSAHLCHPRPSANDNASGVAALLGIARVLAQPADGVAVRFVWGPEFVGLVAYLHEWVHTGRAARPAAAVNVDMAGQDQQRCGGPLVIERTPDELPSYLSALAERCAALLPVTTRSYSGAVGCDTWAWRSTPHVGASDHALLAAAPTRCPAVGLGHWPDRFNHSSADTLDKVDPNELRRTATIAGATVAAVRAAPSDDGLRADLVEATLAWAAGHICAGLPGAAPYRSPVAESLAGDPVLDPWAPEQAGRRMAHRAAVATDAVHSLTALGVPSDRLTADTAWLAALSRGADERSGDQPSALAPGWDGPLNLRALTAMAPPADQCWLADRLAEDRGGGYARMLALARGLDGNRDRVEVAWWAALASELAIPMSFAETFLDVLCRVGWALPVRPAEQGVAVGHLSQPARSEGNR
ncbi:MAG: DUF4910 domain-containing protein [Actinobacteria bacterium]|nr:DUF4910 domain-containing protein [Actinomycetota bacterium]